MRYKEKKLISFIKLQFKKIVLNLKLQKIVSSDTIKMRKKQLY